MHSTAKRQWAFDNFVVHILNSLESYFFLFFKNVFLGNIYILDILLEYYYVNHFVLLFGTWGGLIVLKVFNYKKEAIPRKAQEA